MKTTRFRLFAALSVLWMVILMVANRGDDIPVVFLILGFPVWGFWVSVWIWPLKFNRIFGIGDEVEKRKELKKWVYLDVETAKTSELYGVGGWAFLFLLAIAIPVALNIVVSMDLIDYFKVDETLLADNYPGYQLFSLVGNVQAWIFVALAIVAGYLLITHNKVFQKFFIIVFFAGLITDLIYFIWMVNVMNLNGNEILSSAIIFKIYIGGFIWLLYVIKSKRINLTTKKRIRRKYLDEYIPKDREDAVKKYENTPSS